MWIYWKEQCKYCQNRIDCQYIDKMQELMNNLYAAEHSVKGVYGTLKWTCDYFYFDENEYMAINCGECEAQ